MKNTQLLLINDMCGYGKVALSAMLPVLSHMGYRIHNLPTALVSDTLNYPKFYIHDTTEYVRQSLAIWEELGFEFDAISTGFIVTEEETRIISDFCHRRAQKGTKVFVDPIMGDNGKLYAGVPESTIGLMRRLLECAEYAVPNYTEACLPIGLSPSKLRPMRPAPLWTLCASWVPSRWSLRAPWSMARTRLSVTTMWRGSTSRFPLSSFRSISRARATRSRRCSSAALWPVGACSVRRAMPCAW